MDFLPLHIAETSTGHVVILDDKNRGWIKVEATVEVGTELSQVVQIAANAKYHKPYVYPKLDYPASTLKELFSSASKTPYNTEQILNNHLDVIRNTIFSSSDELSLIAEPLRTFFGEDLELGNLIPSRHWELISYHKEYLLKIYALYVVANEDRGEILKHYDYKLVDCHNTFRNVDPETVDIKPLNFPELTIDLIDFLSSIPIFEVRSLNDDLAYFTEDEREHLMNVFRKHYPKFSNNPEKVSDLIKLTAQWKKSPELLELIDAEELEIQCKFLIKTFNEIFKYKEFLFFKSILHNLFITVISFDYLKTATEQQDWKTIRKYLKAHNYSTTLFNIQKMNGLTILAMYDNCGVDGTMDLLFQLTGSNESYSLINELTFSELLFCVRNYDVYKSYPMSWWVPLLKDSVA